jgi:hypothetical protein
MAVPGDEKDATLTKGSAFVANRQAHSCEVQTEKA